MLKFINIKVFIISFFIGLILIAYAPEMKESIYVYPTPDNVKDIEYKDRMHSCYEYAEEVVDCPDKSKIKTIPIQN